MNLEWINHIICEFNKSNYHYLYFQVHQKTKIVKINYETKQKILLNFLKSFLLKNI